MLRERAIIIVRIKGTMAIKTVLRIVLTIVVVVLLLCQREWELY